MPSIPSWLSATAGAFAGFALCWLIHLVILAGVEKANAKALDDQKAGLEQSCAADKAITERANHDLQANYDGIARRLADAQRLHPARCVVPTAQPPLLEAGGTGHAGADGIGTDWLRGYAAECNRYRVERLALEAFEADVWKEKGAE